MYNEELKTKFIRQYTQSIHTAQVATNILAAMAPYEKAWQADLCTRSTEELQPAIDSIVALRYRSQWMSLTILKEYVKWCILMKVPDACDGMLNITVVGLDKVRRQMVASPLHLQLCLDEVFDEEKDETMDSVYRCHYWMAYGGVKEDDTILVKATDVSFQEMCIKYGEKNVPIYREALPAFRNAVMLSSFLYKHPNYNKPIRRDRVPGDTIMRGIKTVTKTMTFRSTLSKRATEAIKEGKTEVKLSFYRVWLSGVFYRMYERERAGIPVNFSEVATDFMSGKTYHVSGSVKVEHLKKRKERDYMEDYQRWKLAFSI